MVFFNVSTLAQSAVTAEKIDFGTFPNISVAGVDTSVTTDADLTNAKWTVTKSGNYVIKAYAFVNTSENQRIITLRIKKNGTQVDFCAGVPTPNYVGNRFLWLNVIAFVTCSAGDVIKLSGQSDNGSSTLIAIKLSCLRVN